METKNKPTTETANKPKNAVNVPVRSDESEDAATARILTKPELQAAVTMQKWQGGISEVAALTCELAKQIDVVKNGNMKRPEGMLLAQAHTLDELFNNLARRAYGRDYLQQMETLLRLALKAQSQCTRTLEVLAAIKNPPIIYAKQANFANGHQQVNNGVPIKGEFPDAIKRQPHAHTGESKNLQNELITELPHETLDTGRTGETITANQAMAALD